MCSATIANTAMKTRVIIGVMDGDGLTEWFMLMVTATKEKGEMTMNLYELTSQFLQLQQMLEDPDIETQVINDTMEAIEMDLEDKADNYARVIKNMEASVSAIKAEQEVLQQKKNLLELGIKKLKSNLQESMTATGKTKFKTALFSFAIQKNGGKAPVILDVKDTSELPDELVRIKEEADLDAIRILIEKEGSCKYAHLGERGESLRIK